MTLVDSVLSVGVVALCGAQTGAGWHGQKVGHLGWCSDRASTGLALERDWLAVDGLLALFA